MIYMNPWLTEQLMQTRVAEFHRDAQHRCTVKAESLLEGNAGAEVVVTSRLRRGIGRALVRAGSRVGGFDAPRTVHLA